MLKVVVPSNTPFVGRRVELDQLHQTLGSVITAQKPNFVLIQGDIGVGKTALVERFLAEATAQYPSALVGLGKCAMETELNGLIPLGQLLAQLTRQAIQRRIWPGNWSDFAQEFAPAWIGFSSAAQAPSYLSVLRQNITRLFNLEELRTLCFDLHVDLESLGGEGKEAKARELVAFLDRNGRTLELVETCARQRPDAAWQSILEMTRAAHSSRSSQPESAKEAAALLDRSVFSQENLFVQFTNALSRLAENQPVVAVIEDLHWADASSLHLLFHLARNLQNRAVLFVCTHRLIELQTAGSNVELLRKIRANLILDGAVRLDLNEGIDVAEYITQRYPRNTFPPDLIERIRQQTEGHALFVSQLFSWWEAKGMIVATAGPDGQPAWGLARVADAFPAIPPTMDEVLEARIRSMQDDLREVLTYASVEGDDFTVQVITRLRQLDEYKTYDSLETLSQQYRLVQEHGTGEVGSIVLDFYRFVHRFFREYIYSQLSSGKRRILHRQVGECLEALYSDRQPIAGQLALHFREARDHLKAARYALMAAQFEQSRCAWAECEKWCQFGLALIDETAAETKPLRLDLLEQSGYGYFASGTYSPAEDRYRAALALAQQLQAEAERIALIYDRLADIANLGRTEEALSLVELGRQILAGRTTPHDATYFKLEATWAGTQSALGNYDLAIQHLQRILAEAEQLPPSPQLDRVRASAYNELALAFTSVNQYAKSLAASQKAIEAGQVAGRSQAIGWLDMAMTYFNLGQVEESMACTLKGLELARKIGDLGEMAYGQASKGFLLLAQGKPGEAVTELTEAIALSERIGLAWGMDDMHADLAMAYLALSDLERADQSARRGLEYAEQTRDHFKLGYALDALARVEAARQEWESALNHFNQAIDYYKQDRNPDFVARAQRHLAEALLSRGDRQQAAQLLQAALATYQALELPHGVAEIQRLLQQAVSDSGSV